MSQPKKFDRQEVGKPIRAGTINMPLDALEPALNLSVTAPLAMLSTPAGTVIYSQAQEPFWARITSGTGAGPYDWLEVTPQSGGGWDDGHADDAGGEDPAYNTFALTPSSLPLIVELKRDAAGILRFSLGSC